MTVVADLTKELPRDTWGEYFDRLSRELGTVEATIEVDGADIGAQIEAENLVLTGVTYDRGDDVLVVGLDARGGAKEDVEHLVYQPQRIFVDGEASPPGAIAVDDADGRRTLLELRPVPELPG
jgi:hypothetical protein